ncbi:translation initiation factor IF-2 [Streptomyces lincolnensis]|uniref:translation initiation factor IF-2 n=1 Tax=Streptomyces lincolnensis TaxID=1915 RepID=UPI0037D82CDC
MPTQGPGGTPFENMSHEQMLAWLDQANAGTVQAAADRLIAAAKEIRKIADELKVRPQYVEWKGDGADAFRTWTGDLANSTLRLGDFSEDAAKWLSQASGAIAVAQSSIPRDMPSAKANLAAATTARNDPDAAAVSAKSRSELEALTANREKVRLEAAAQMRKLGQSYQVSSAQMGALERPKFPPPPTAIAPPEATVDSSRRDRARPSASGQVVSPSGATETGASDVRGSSATPSPETRVLKDVAPPARMDIDSVATLPQRPPSPADVPHGPPSPEPVKGGMPSQPGVVPPVFGSGGTRVPGNGPVGPGRTPAASGRSPLQPGHGTVSNPIRTPGGAASSGSGNGIVGGRPVPSPTGRPTTGIPRGTVVGGEGTAPRGPMGPAAGSSNVPGRAAGPQGQGRTSASTGGVVGGRPLPNDRTGAGQAQQPGRQRAVTSGPGSAGTTTGSGISGRGVVGGTSNSSRPGDGHGPGGPRPSQPTPPTNSGSRSGRPYGVVEDEETWRQGNRPAVPPVID